MSNDYINDIAKFISEQNRGKVISEATYKYDDNKAPRDAEVSSGYGDINDKAVHKHLTSSGVPHEHATAIVAHLKHEDHEDSDKKGYDVKSKHGKYTVHSYSDPDTGKSKFAVHE